MMEALPVKSGQLLSGQPLPCKREKLFEYESATVQTAEALPITLGIRRWQSIGVLPSEVATG
ncbi:MAG: hypothetical protein QOJ42_6191 [Acidobacteriaceae bacterium]|jgi:hypothetical protein|nr:hypothetical protein [Acidobacteriaceae bacterium]